LIVVDAATAGDGFIVSSSCTSGDAAVVDDNYDCCLFY